MLHIPIAMTPVAWIRLLYNLPYVSYYSPFGVCVLEFVHFGTRSIASWFDERGVLHKDKLQEDLSSLQRDVKHKKEQ